MKLTFLGTGTSAGIPLIGCQCRVCLSKAPKDKRLRCSALISSGNTRILIDAGPDIRTQLLSQGTQYLNGVLITHSHYDHIFGLDELRPFTIYKNIDIYAESHTMKDIMRVYSYIFDQTNVQIGGGLTQFTPNIIKENQIFKIRDIEILPVRVMHGRLPILGYKIGRLAYLTDVKTLDETSIAALQGTDTLVINCLRPKAHPTHLNIDEALAYIDMIKPRKTYLIHMDHELSHSEWESQLPHYVQPAYDGLEITID